jgi:hypothetical protein
MHEGSGPAHRFHGVRLCHDKADLRPTEAVNVNNVACLCWESSQRSQWTPLGLQNAARRRTPARKSLRNLVGLPRFELGTSCTPSKRAGATGAIAFRYLTSHTACDSVKIAQTTVQSARYSAENHGIRKATVGIAVVGAPTLEHYWEDGPQVTGWSSVVGKASRRNDRDRGRDIRQRLGDPQRRSPRGSGTLAARNELQYAGKRRQCLCGGDDPGRAESVIDGKSLRSR